MLALYLACCPCVSLCLALWPMPPQVPAALNPCCSQSCCSPAPGSCLPVCVPVQPPSSLQPPRSLPLPTQVPAALNPGLAQPGPCEHPPAQPQRERHIHSHSHSTQHQHTIARPGESVTGIVKHPQLVASPIYTYELKQLQGRATAAYTARGIQHPQLVASPITKAATGLLHGPRGHCLSLGVAYATASPQPYNTAFRQHQRSENHSRPGDGRAQNLPSYPKLYVCVRQCLPPLTSPLNQPLAVIIKVVPYTTTTTTTMMLRLLPIDKTLRPKQRVYYYAVRSSTHQNSGP